MWHTMTKICNNSRIQSEISISAHYVTAGAFVHCETFNGMSASISRPTASQGTARTADDIDTSSQSVVKPHGVGWWGVVGGCLNAHFPPRTPGECAQNR